MIRPDVLLTGGRVYTGDPTAPWAAAVLTLGNRIAHVGTARDARAQAEGPVEEISVPEGLVVPGLIDSHVHLILAACLC